MFLISIIIVLKKFKALFKGQLESLFRSHFYLKQFMSLETK